MILGWTANGVLFIKTDFADFYSKVKIKQMYWGNTLQLHYL